MVFGLCNRYSYASVGVVDGVPCPIVAALIASIRSELNESG